jgi:hypothetical protein
MNHHVKVQIWTKQAPSPLSPEKLPLGPQAFPPPRRAGTGSTGSGFDGRKTRQAVIGEPDRGIVVLQDISQLSTHGRVAGSYEALFIPGESVTVVFCYVSYFHLPG